MKQYMPMKPTKTGFTAWLRAYAVNSYFCEFEVYYSERSANEDTSSDLVLGSALC
jgi:hypothetical protein